MRNWFFLWVWIKDVRVDHLITKSIIVRLILRISILVPSVWMGLFCESRVLWLLRADVTPKSTIVCYIGTLLSETWLVFLKSMNVNNVSMDIILTTLKSVLKVTSIFVRFISPKKNVRNVSSLIMSLSIKSAKEILLLFRIVPLIIKPCEIIAWIVSMTII